MGFIGSQSDTSQFVYTSGQTMAYLLLYVDDIILTASFSSALASVSCSFSELFLSQRKYLTEILQGAHMADCNPCNMLVDTLTKLYLTSGPPIADPTLYRSLAGARQYLTFPILDISYVVKWICLFMHDPLAPHFAALKHILRYLRGTLDHSHNVCSASASNAGGC